MKRDSTWQVLSSNLIVWTLCLSREFEDKLTKPHKSMTKMAHHQVIKLLLHGPDLLRVA